MGGISLRWWSQILDSTSTSTSTINPTKWLKIDFYTQFEVEVEVEPQIWPHKCWKNHVFWVG
jgi:hypothetical protein